tara:strand:- start:106 stop:294 length:189 start_codon:yes stop_codon:yes gene_type:complete
MRPSEIAMQIFASLYDKQHITAEDIHDCLTVRMYAGSLPALNSTDVDVAVDLVTSLNKEYNR